MKKLVQLIVLGTMLAAFALPSVAQDTAAAQPSQEEQEAKSALYKKFTDTYNRGKEILKNDPKLAQPGNKEAFAAANREANQYATEYLQKYPNDTGQIPDYLKKFVASYAKSEKEGRKTQLVQLFTDKKYDEGFALGRQILNDEPNDLLTLYTLARNGLFAAATGSETNNAATAQYAKKAIQLLQAGGDLPGQPKDETLGILNYALGVSSIKSTPSDAVGAFIQVATLANSAKTDPQTYYLLAIAYQAAEYDKLASDYKTQCSTAEQIASPTCKAMTDRLNLVVDRVIDAYARAVSLSGTNPTYAARKTEWMKSLTDFYKYRHEGKEDGLKEYIAGITNQPLPSPLPAAGTTPAPTSSTPATSGSTASTGNMTPMATGQNTTPGTTTTTPASTTAPQTKPASTTPASTTAPKTTTTAPKKTTPKKAHAGRH